MNALDNYYSNQEEPAKSCLLAMRDIIMAVDEEITHELKYGMPFFCYKRKMFCYLWTEKKTGQPYIGIVEGKHIEHPLLIQEKRSRMKVMMLNADADLPIKTIKEIVNKALDLYKTGVIKTK